MDTQSLRSIIKSSRDLMRKDEGLNTDVDRIPQLAWILFLKCFDDFERKQEQLNKNYQGTIPIPYRWRDWTNGKKDISTGPQLIEFVNGDLFPTLAKLDQIVKNEKSKVISEIFKGLTNNIASGKILGQILNQINKINFISSDDIHIMAKVYEDMLLEMKDAAGSNGEFYTPRPVIRFIVNIIEPSLKKSENVLDPACGTGGFLIEALEYMKEQVRSESDFQKLFYKTIYGIEKKSMPYLLAMMNMLLHEIERPNLIRANTLSQLWSSEEFDVIITNPPFGGEEEREIASTLPNRMKTTDSALAFLLYIMSKLRKEGRCGIILPDGPLFAGGVAARIRKKIIEEFNLHTIVRLPESVFSPYTGIATNILFFDKHGPTKKIWFYKMKIREGIKSYSKTKPITYNDFSEVIEWFERKTINENAWIMDINDLINYNLDVKNPNFSEEKFDLSPNVLIDKILMDEENTLTLLKEVKKLIEREIKS